MKKITGLVVCMLLATGMYTTCFAQSDSCGLRVSLLTCSPGEELYSSFGHTAIRVTDSAAGTDLVFNYGTFDDADPYFYAKFTRGLMRYALSVYPYSDFQWEYRAQQRSVIEQVLQLTCAEKQKLYEALKRNGQEENRYYDYYFLEDNCTTRARDMILQHTDTPVVFSNILPASVPTFRQLIHSYLNKSGQPWSKLGIDILLGSRLDRKVDNQSATFLPDYLMEGLDSATLRGQPLVGGKRTVLNIPVATTPATWLTPFIFFLLMALIVALLTFVNNKWIRWRLLIFDRFFFLVLGLLGILLAVLWIIRYDTVCRDNLNLLWALPTHAFFAFVLHKHKRWIATYLRFTIIILAVVLAGWFFLPQQLNPALIPVLATILLRCSVRLRLITGKK